MENSTRTAMLIPFSDYEKKMPNKKESDKEADKVLKPIDFKGVKPTMVTGHIYPDLYSQASYLNKDIEDVKTGIAEAVDELFDSIGEEAVIVSIESIYDYVGRTLNTEGNDMNEMCEFTWKGLRDIESEVYCRKEMAKTMLSLMLKRNRLNELESNIEKTKQNILL